MTLDDAREQMRGLDEEYAALLAEMGGGEDSPAVADEESAAGVRARANRALHRRLGERLAGYPRIRPHLQCWMVDVHGVESNLGGPADFEEGLGLLHAGDAAGFAARAGGALAQQVERLIRDELGLRVTDSGGGCGGWHLGTPCGDAEMQSLTAALHARFAKAIAADLLRVTVKFWKWRFRAE